MHLKVTRDILRQFRSKNYIHTSNKYNEMAVIEMWVFLNLSIVSGTSSLCFISLKLKI